jgi:hypothetical protein
MIRKMLLIALLLVGVCTFAQELPKIIPVSPEASSLGKYTEIPAATYTGIPQINIPIWDLQQNGIKLPINISYHSAGIKVTEIASWVGTGWSLNYGGAVFRSTRGLPDDISGGYLTVTGDRKVKVFSNASQERRRDLLQLASDGNLDYEADIFQFSILGYSGKFIFDQETKDVVFFSKDDIKITPIYQDPVAYKDIKEWKIILPNGIQCHFGKGKAYDFSLLNQNFSDKGGRGGLSTTSSHKTAWYISSIKDINGDIVEFSYDQYEKDVCTLGGQQDSFGIASQNAPCNFPITNFSKVTSYSNNNVLYAKIKEINAIDTKIVFVPETSNREDFEKDKALHKIEVYNTLNNTLITSYVFNYYYSFNPEGSRVYPSPCINPQDPNEVGKRLFLSSVQQQKGAHKIPPHQFYYNPIKLPARTSFSQDYWGFYNGAENSSLIPEVHIKNIWAPNPGTADYLTLNGANRRVDAAKSKAGILNKIVYPTGGYTEYVYENNIANNADRFGFNDYEKPDIRPNILATLSSSELNVDDPNTWIIEKKFTVEENSCNPSIDLPSIYIKSKYTCVDRNDCLYVLRLDGTILPTDRPEATCIELSPGEHTLELELYRPPGEGMNIPSGFAQILKANTVDVPQNQIVTVGSQRIKQIQLHDNATGTIVKNYEYENGEALNLPVYTNLRQAQYSCHFGSNPPSTYFETVPVYTRKSNSFTSLSSIGGGYVGYKKVTEYILDKNTSGTTEYLFSFYDDNISRTFPFKPSTSLDWRRGNLLEKKYYQNRADQKTLIKEEKNTYKYYNSTSLSGLYVFNPNYGNTEDLLAFKLDYRSYPTMGETVKLIATESKEYFPAVFSTSTKYYYDGINHLQTTKVETTNSKGEIVSTKTYYPNDVNNTNDLGNDDLTSIEKSSIDKLKVQHRITAPIQVETAKDDVLLSTKRTNYKDWGSGIVLPTEIQTLKGIYNANTNQLEDRIIYHKYDIQGNPLEVSLADGSHIMYVWGYNNTQPIVKIANASYTGIPATATSLITQLQTASNTEDTAAEEVTMRNLFKNLREDAYFADAQITGYTYNPLIGVTSITDPKDHTAYYRYDEFNRLQYGLDDDQHIAQQIRYNYQGEQMATLGDVTIDLPGSVPTQPNQAVTFTANTSGSGGADLYTWSVNGTQEQCDATTSFTKSFSSEGTYAVSVLAYNTQTKHRVSKTMNVVVAYPPIVTPVAIFIGATKAVFEPTNTLSSISVKCLLAPS